MKKTEKKCDRRRLPAVYFLKEKAMKKLLFYKFDTKNEELLYNPALY